jgi:hypothetical protein
MTGGCLVWSDSCAFNQVEYTGVSVDWATTGR